MFARIMFLFAFAASSVLILAGCPESDSDPPDTISSNSESGQDTDGPGESETTPPGEPTSGSDTGSDTTEPESESESETGSTSAGTDTGGEGDGTGVEQETGETCDVDYEVWSPCDAEIWCLPGFDCVNNTCVPKCDDSTPGEACDSKGCGATKCNDQDQCVLSCTADRPCEVPGMTCDLGLGACKWDV